MNNNNNNNDHKNFNLFNLKEVTRLTVLDIVDNETDALSGPCSYMKPIPNIRKEGNNTKNNNDSDNNNNNDNNSNNNSNSDDNTNNSIPEDDRVCTYTQELIPVINDTKSLDFIQMTHAAHGLSLLLIAEYDVEVEVDNEDNNDNDNSKKKIIETKTSHILIDGGPDPTIWKENAKKLNIKLHEIDTIILSHYHADHSYGLLGAVEMICDAKIEHYGLLLDDNNGDDDDVNVNVKVPLIIDLRTSKIVSRGLKIRGKVYPMKPDNPTCDEFERLGGHVQLHDKAHLVGNDCFYVSGDIPRNTSFEEGIPGNFNGLPDGKSWVLDSDISDERYVAVKILGRGVIVFSSCSHAGIVNVCNDVTNKLDSKLTGVVGGFHLAGSSVEGRIKDTINGLKVLDPDILLAGHCTGWKAKAQLHQAFEYNFQPLTVGGRYIFNSIKRRGKYENEGQES